MARIQQYQSQQKDSPAVGTPGMDTSGVDIAGTVGTVAETMLKAQREKQDIADRVAAQRRILEWDAEDETALQETQAAYVGSGAKPSDEVAAFRKRSEDLFTSKLSSIKSDGERTYFNRLAFTMRKERFRKAQAGAFARQSADTVDNITASMNMVGQSIAKQMADPTLTVDQKNEAFHHNFQLMVGNIDASKGALGREAHKKLRADASQMMAKAAVVGALDGAPADALALLESGEFDDELTPEERSSYLQKAKDRIQKFREIADENRMVNLARANGQLFNRIASGEPGALADIENAPVDEATRDLFREAYLSGNEKIVPIGNVAEGVVKLKNEYKTLFDSDGKIQYGKSIEDLLKFQDQVLRSYKSGEITRDKARTYFEAYGSNIGEALAEMKSGQAGPATGRVKAVRTMIDATEAWLTSQRRSTDDPALNNVAFDFMNSLANVDVNDDAQVSAAISSAIQKQTLRENPILNTVKGTPNAILDSGKKKPVKPGESDMASEGGAKPAFRIFTDSAGKRIKVPLDKNGAPQRDRAEALD